MNRYAFLIVAILNAFGIACESATAEPVKDDLMVNFGENVGANARPASWSSAGTLSTPDAAGVRPDRLVSLQTQFEPAAYTIEFGLFDNHDSGATGSKNAAAEVTVQWSLGGNTITRIFSLTNGCSITGVADGVSVRVRDVTVDDPGFDGYDYQVSIGVAKGTRASNGMPILWRPEFTGAVFSAASAFIAVPQNVGINAVRIYAGRFFTALALANITQKDVIFSQMDGDSGGNVLTEWNPITGAEWVALLPGCKSIRIEIPTANSSLNYAAVFSIDG